MKIECCSSNYYYYYIRIPARWTDLKERKTKNMKSKGRKKKDKRMKCRIKKILTKINQNIANIKLKENLNTSRQRLTIPSWLVGSQTSNSTKWSTS